MDDDPQRANQFSANLLVAVIGIAVGVTGAIATQPLWARKPAKPCCAPKKACPVRLTAHGLEEDDSAAGAKLRAVLMDGILRPWVELGRAPTSEETAKRLGKQPEEIGQALRQLESCAQEDTFGLLRLPQSSLVAVAWPLSNAPTGITVSVEGGWPVFARCAIDALGISQMLGRRATIDAVAGDGTQVRILVDGKKIVSAEPAGAVVLSGADCDDTVFFSSNEALADWRAKHGGIGGEVLTLAQALERGVVLFGGLGAGLKLP